MTRRGKSIIRWQSRSLARHRWRQAVSGQKVLTLPLTLDIMRENQWVFAWSPSGGRVIKRDFYWSPKWMEVRNGLVGRRSTEINDNNKVPDVDLAAMDLSERGRLDGFVESYVIGEPRRRLVRPLGYGMEPPFHRMLPPLQAVVEMCTVHTRTFGFFARKNVFVALRLDRANATHANTELYRFHGSAVKSIMNRLAASDKDETSDVEELIGDLSDEQ